MKAFFQLIRIPNLIIIAATQYLMRYAILNTLLKNIFIHTGESIVNVPGLELQLSDFQFLSLVLATIFLAAAGYVINDYFDTKTDLLNRPERVIVGKSIPRRVAMAIHVVLNVIGICFGIYVSYSIGLVYFGFVFILVSGLLWFYSTTYKRQFLIGNLLIAFLTGLVPFMVAIFEIPPLLKEYNQILVDYQVNLNHVIVWIGGFSFFAFITTLIRELIKDMEDFEGDRAFGRNSLPVVLGLKSTKIIVFTLLLITLFSLVLVYMLNLHLHALHSDRIAALLIPMTFLIFRLYKAETQKDYHFLSTFSKFIMLSGLVYAILVHFIIEYQLNIVG